MTRKAPNPYSVHPSVAYVQALLRNLEKHTGRDLDGWVGMLKAEALGDEVSRRAWLKAQGLGGSQARFVAERSMGGSAHAFDDTPEGYLALAPEYVDRQYAARRTGLRPLYDALLDLILALGADVKACPCETLVPFYRKHVFAQLKPTTLTRIDLGLALGDPMSIQDKTGRLIDTGGFQKKDRLTHRIEVKTAADIDAELKRWLRQAYEREAG